MKKCALFVAVLAISCGEPPLKFAEGDNVVTKKRCMATTDEYYYNEMQAASDNRNEKALMEMMNTGKLLILNEGQPGTVATPAKEKSQIKILGGSKWWVANKFLKKE